MSNNQVVIVTPRSEEDVQRLIEVWHETYEGKLELHEFIGFSVEQYAAWVEGRAILKPKPD